MSKALTRPALAMLAALCFVSTAAPAQTTLEWIVLSPAREGFTARMPAEPAPTEQRVRANGMDASGLRYASDAGDATTFVVWSMKGSRAGGQLGRGDRPPEAPYGATPYLDEAAELAWELVIPEVKRLEKRGVKWWRRSAGELRMIYMREFAVGGLPAREYSVRRGRVGGRVYVCSEGAQVYVVAALGADAADAQLREFVDSFALKSAPPAPPKVVGGDAVGPGFGRVTVESGTPKGGYVGGGGFGGGGGDAGVDYSRPFRQVEVTKKAVITDKPEAGFTEQARKFWVTGVVRLRAVLHPSGEARNVTVVKGLPHGLTQKAVAAAKRIRFKPAQKDGRDVSQYAVFDYNFNIY
jgi:TonB family protein